jgi:hypothetical protein
VQWSEVLRVGVLSLAGKQPHGGMGRVLVFFALDFYYSEIGGLESMYNYD